MSDQNPYQPPDSDLGERPKSEPVVWKVFFWLTATLMSLSLLSVGFMQDLKWFDYLDLLISVIATVGLYGFAFHKRLINVVFWRYFFYLAVADSFIFALVLPLIGVPVYGQPAVFDVLYLTSCAYSVAMLYAVYHYAYRRPTIWDQ